MSLKLPIRCHREPTITQPFGSMDNAAWYESMGISPSHNGVDFVVGNSQQTYGTECVCPFLTAQVSKRNYDGPMSTSGNGITITGQYQGKNYALVFWHLSEIATQNSFKFGETVGWMGNSGACKPPPSMKEPYAGAHLHLMAYVWDGYWKLIDPMTIIDFNDRFVGPDPGFNKDKPPLEYFLEVARKWLVGLLKP